MLVITDIMLRDFPLSDVFFMYSTFRKLTSTPVFRCLVVIVLACLGINPKTLKTNVTIKPLDKVHQVYLTKYKNNKTLGLFPCKHNTAVGVPDQSAENICELKGWEGTGVCRKVLSEAFTIYVYQKLTPWPESASELYQPSDNRLSVKIVPTFFADRGATWSARLIPTAVFSAF
jgi:hypothetical protein